MLIPQPGRIRRWLQQDQGRPVFPGLFLPIWWDLRLQQQHGPAYAHDEQPDDGEDTALLQRHHHAQEEGDSLQLMQRSGSRTPRRDFTTPSSVSSSLSPVLAHVFHLSSEHRLITFDRAAPLSFFQQLDRLWKRPAHAHSIALHEVKTPPSDLETSGDVTFLFEQAPDRNRQAAPTDQLILLDIEIYSHGETTPGKHIRRVLWSRRLINRQAMLSLTASVSLCEVPGTTCELSINSHIWLEEDTANRHVLHGDFIRLRIDAASPSDELHMALCEQESADAQRYVYGRSPSRSPTPSDSLQPDEEDEPSEEAASLSLFQISAVVTPTTKISKQQGDNRPRDILQDVTNVIGTDTHKVSVDPHVTDRWCGGWRPSAVSIFRFLTQLHTHPGYCCLRSYCPSRTSKCLWLCGTLPFFCKAQAMIAERKILLCKLLSSGESETIEIKPCSTIVYILGVSGKRFRQLTEKNRKAGLGEGPSFR